MVECVFCHDTSISKRKVTCIKHFSLHHSAQLLEWRALYIRELVDSLSMYRDDVDMTKVPYIHKATFLSSLLWFLSVSVPSNTHKLPKIIHLTCTQANC